MTQVFDFENSSRKPERIALRLDVTDPESVEELRAQDEGAARDEFALTALRIGILALKQARGRIDADTVQREGDRLMQTLQSQLERHQENVQEQVASRLREYFDPQSGHFTDRVDRLVKKDGDLEALLRRQVGAEDSQLQRTLAAHIGSDSALMRWLSSDESEGLLGAMQEAVGGQLAEQREKLLQQFSLDNKDGALSRLIRELTERHGAIRDDLQGSMKEIVAEFSLDREGSALNRLVNRVEKAQKQISDEFSLDADASALARMKRELMDVLQGHREESERFRSEVRSALAAMQARRAESLRSTRHGEVFEQAVVSFVRADGERRGDIVDATGNTVGRIKNCKVGDCVITLGPDQAAGGGRVAIEAKESGQVSVGAALDEMQLARKNRDASAGVFVLSTQVAPEAIDPLQRFGPDVIVVWDAEDPASDVYFHAALSLARGLCTRAELDEKQAAVDLESFDRAVRSVEKQAGTLKQILTHSDTIDSANEKIRSRAKLLRDGLGRDVERLDRLQAELRAHLQAESGEQDHCG